MSAERPVILIDPAVRFGRPHIGGISTEAVAGMVMAGEPVCVVQDEYGLTRHQVLLACWWEGTAGVYRREWKAWADKAHPVLGGWVWPFDLDQVPDPPSRTDRNKKPHPDATESSTPVCNYLNHKPPGKPSSTNGKPRD